MTRWMYGMRSWIPGPASCGHAREQHKLLAATLSAHGSAGLAVHGSAAFVEHGGARLRDEVAMVSRG